MLKKLFVCLWIGILCILTFGCSGAKEELAKVKDLDFTVVATENVPDGLLDILDDKKAEPFYQAYSDGEFMYLCVGYGEQVSGGYSITVDALYLTEEAVCMETTLIGPDVAEEVPTAHSYPYVVICTEYMDRPIMFE